MSFKWYLAIVLTLLMPAIVVAHHGTNATYDQSTTIVLTGTVSEFKFANPHVEILLDVKDKRGSVVNWTVEGTSLYYWSKAGWNKSSMKAGDQVTVTINPAKSGARVGNLVKLVHANGKKFVTEANGENIR
jgi:hypothetical protein